METVDVSNLNSLYLDVLRELGNIGTGNALTALSAMTGKKLDMHVPMVKILKLSQVPDLMGNPEEKVAGVFFEMTGDIKANILFVLNMSSAREVVDIVLGSNRADGDFGDMEVSAISEISNILVASYVNALSHLMNLKLTISPPAYSADMAGAILSVPAVQFGEVGDYALYIETEFLENDKRIDGYIFLIPDVEGIGRIMKHLGVGC
ncbi:chemotaxis protein CheC [Caldanaerobius polysaccharolyticus]|uniref:chemotaxis protein CheC n=1 Tax=Caldanaerobius polysaccharolyticus TaxID=44256 RepID=UPI00068D2A53|nr:chemotaxis protein CheC [Caldanaerobius polysaccharolyticus]